MSRKMSIHIALEKADPKVYGINQIELKGCKNDMHDMQKIACSQKFDSIESLLNEEATRDNVATALKSAAKKLKKGDLLLLTYSGHGTFFKNEDRVDEEYDQSWCLYDGFMLDSELHYFWTCFNEGVEIFMISDSCHSGTMSKDMFQDGFPIEKGILEEDAKLIYLKNQEYYNGIKKRILVRDKRTFGATVLLISGCRDEESSHIFPPYKNSLLTEVISEVWNDGKFEGTTCKFFAQVQIKVKTIALKKQKTQKPMLTVIGKKNSDFTKRKPFVI